MRYLPVFLSVTIVLATCVVGAGAAIYSPQQQLPAATISAFKLTPAQLLEEFAAGGAGLTSRVRELAASDPSTLPYLIDLLKSTEPRQYGDPQKVENASKQSLAIAAGLAQVARLASRSVQEQGYATEIQTAVVGSGNSYAIDEYRRLIGDVAIGAANGGGGGGGAGGGGGGSGTGGSTGTSGIVFGGSNSGSSTFNARNYSNSSAPLGTGSVGSVVNAGSASNSVSRF